MKYFLFILVFISSGLAAQTTLKFDQHMINCKDKWVVYPPNRDSLYPFGFIYLDQQAGLTLNYEGSFKILPTGEFQRNKTDTIDFKVRLEPNNKLVALVPAEKYKALNIPIVPEWLKNYQGDTNAANNLFALGYMYNLWGDSYKALTYLNKVKEQDPSHKGLNIEMAYAYNALQRFDSA